MKMSKTAAPEVLADYRILGVLGEGNNGTFYLAEPPARLGLATDRVALKVFNSYVSKDAYRRGVRELRAFAAVRSPRLVQIYDAVLEDSFFYAMEYCPLGSLAEPARPLTRPEILAALEDAARAVHELHEHGMVHGDVKPENILVVDGGGKLSDLGLVRVLNSGASVTSFAPAASVEYIDPDLLQGDLPSRETDVWALGATINQALGDAGLYGDLPTGQPMLAIRAVVSGRAKVSDALSQVEADLVRACIAPKGRRLATAAEVADRLSRLH